MRIDEGNSALVVGLDTENRMDYIGRVGCVSTVYPGLERGVETSYVVDFDNGDWSVFTEASLRVL